MSGTTSDAEDEPADASAPAQGDAAKERFRAALDRKRGLQADRAAAGGPHGDSKIHGEHGALGGKRTFRRKSGG
jgi:hypothetical protein